MGQTGGLQANQQNYQQCFIGHSVGASWRETFEQVCEEVLPNFDLKPWYADKYYQGSIPLREKVVNMIATTRYGIYDLSYWRENDQSAWIMPRNVLIELGMAIALNRPMLLLRHGKNRECGLTLPTCLEGIAIGEFGDGKKLLRETLSARLPALTQHMPKQDWINRYCHFGGLECAYREAHPQAQQWGRQKIHIHISDGANAAHIDCSDFRDMIEEEVIYRFNDLEFNYLDSLVCPQGCKFLLCSRCQEVRSSPFAIYRVTPHTSADTFIAIGMSIALEKQFKYSVTKILVTDNKDNIPSLLEGYEIIVERNYTGVKDRLNLILPEMIEKTRQTTWKPKTLPFEVFLPTKELAEPEEIDATEAHSENDTQAEGDEDSSLQQEIEEEQDIDQMGDEPTRDDRFDKFSERARKVLRLAQEEAQIFRHNYIGTEHLLLGLVREGEGITAKVLVNFGVDLNKVRKAVEVIVGRGDRIVPGEIGFNTPAKKAIELAVDEADHLYHNYIGTEHLLLGLVRVGEGTAAGILDSFGVDLEMVGIQILQMFGDAPAPATVDIDRDIDQMSRNLIGDEGTKNVVRFPKKAVRQPTLVLIAGLPGAGASTLALELGRRLGWTVLEKDKIKEQFLKDPLLKEDYDEYSADWAAYKYFLNITENILVNQQLSVILNLSLLDLFDLERVTEQAIRSGAQLKIILCEVDESTRQHRLRTRKARISEAKDHLVPKEAVKVFEQLDPSSYKRIETNRPLKICVEKALTYVSPGRGA